MKRSASQVLLLIFSIIEIILAVLMLVGAVGTGVLGGFSGEISAADYESMGLTQSELFGSMMVLTASLVISAIWALLCGIFGIRAANNASKIGIVWTFCLIGLILCIAGLVISLVSETFEWRIAINLAVALVMFVISNNIKRQARNRR